MGVHRRSGGVLRRSPRRRGGAWLRWSSSSPYGWWWRCGGLSSRKGRRAFGRVAPFLFLARLWVMGYVLCLTHNLCPPSRFPFPILHPSGRPSACASPRAAPRLVGGFIPSAWHCGGVRGSSQSRSQSRSQSLVPLRRQRRSQSGSQSGSQPPLWRIWGTLVEPDRVYPRGARGVP